MDGTLLDDNNQIESKLKDALMGMSESRNKANTGKRKKLSPLNEIC